MKITNKNNLPEQFVRAAVSSLRRPVPDRMGITRLIGPPQVTRLLAEHWDDIEADCSEYLWSIMGTSVHLVLERYSGITDLAETKLEIEVPFADRMITVVGVSDLYDGLTHLLTDWKFTSAWSAVYGIHDEWISQLNLNAWLLRRNEVPIRGMGVWLMFRDWSRTQALRSPDYPKQQIKYVPVEDWGMHRQEHFLSQCIERHFRDTESPCSDEERWYRGETWAVMKEGRKSALRVLQSQSEAAQWVEGNVKAPSDLKKVSVVLRPGKYIRCSDYCVVRSVCPQWTAMQDSIEEGSDEQGDNS